MKEITKKWLRLIKSLHDKKNRVAEKCFIVEGEKMTLELLQNPVFSIKAICCTSAFAEIHEKKLTKTNAEILLTKESDLESAGSFKTNNAAIAVVEMPVFPPPMLKGFILVLDDIKDPGNLGTIIRIADWFGIKQIVCSETTVDVYNPKVIAASMGSFMRVLVYYKDLVSFLQDAKKMQIWGAFLGGKEIQDIDFGEEGILVIGSESHGISKAIENCITQKVTIPRFGEAESLNAAIATAIFCERMRLH